VVGLESIRLGVNGHIRAVAAVLVPLRVVSYDMMATAQRDSAVQLLLSFFWGK
jgi:hypothetical protein